MSATLNLYSLTLAHGDATANNNPSLRFVDWKRALQGVPVENPKSEALIIPPGVEKLVFDGTRTLTIDGTTALDLELSTLSSDMYRLTHVGGSAPGFRADRALDLTAIELTLTVQANGTLVMAAAAGTPFASLAVGDEVFIPGLLTGDISSPFNAMNQGRWTVLGAGDAAITLIRPSGQDFQGLSEVVTPVDAAQVLGYAADGVQLGDSLDLSAGFSSSAQKTFEIVGVTGKWVEIRSTAALAAEAGVSPGAAGLKVYSNSKRFLRIEADQNCVIRLNGDTGSSVRLCPWVSADPEHVAEFVKVGPTWSLSILNRSAQALRVNVISAE